MKAIIIKQIKDGYKGILERRNNGWADEELNSYTTGVSNTLADLINELQGNGFITDKEAEEIEEVFSTTIDTLEF
ncbi:CtsR C-terminal dimerization domain protein [Enterococcus phage 53]|uniref:CtsR C-terminal dimerization domain protein n=1 Tax=Enterococcus phage 53 TaxID=3028143 RepID=UPI0040342480|nr:CtsR C-terminal dimerization domain protein [Enterococcus phage 53]